MTLFDKIKRGVNHFDKVAANKTNSFFGKIKSTTNNIAGHIKNAANKVGNFVNSDLIQGISAQFGPEGVELRQQIADAARNVGNTAGQVKDVVQRLPTNSTSLSSAAQQFANH